MDSSIVTRALGGLQGPFATVDGVELTAGSAQLVLDAIGSMTDKSLKAKRGELGYRGLDANTIRANLSAAVRTNAPLPTFLVQSLRKRLPASRVIELFSESFIDRVERIWPNIFGQHAAGLALIIDGRPGLRKVGQLILHAHPSDIAMDIHEAREVLLREIQACFLGHVATFTAEFRGAPATKLIPEEETEPTPTSGVDLRNVAGHVATEIASLKEQIVCLKRQLQEQAAAFEERVASKETEWARRLEAEQSRSQRTTALEAQVKAGREREQQLLDSLSAWEKMVEDEIKKRVDRELAAVARPWLEEARRLQGLSANRTDKSLTDKAIALLRAQEALDMKHGSRTRLRRRLKDFEDYANKIRYALEDSIKPSEDLAPLLVEIESEIQRTRVVLGEDRPQSSLVNKLEEAINKVGNSDSLDALSENIAALHNAGVFTHKEHLRLTKQQLKAYDRLRTREELKPTVQLRRSGWELCQVVASNKKAMVYLDGNNVVHRDDRYAHLFDESGRVNEEVEKALQRDVLAVASKCPAVKFRVVFDSHSASREALTDNVIVHRSGGSGSDRADSAIVLHLTEAPDGDSRFVITDDNSLRQQTTRLGGVYADVTIWSFLVEELGQQRLPMAEDPPATTPG